MYTWYLFYYVELSNFVYNFIQASFVLHFMLLFKERFSSKWLSWHLLDFLVHYPFFFFFFFFFFFLNFIET
jgi:hypothetical protein